jgi:hypothetical protein
MTTVAKQRAQSVVDAAGVASVTGEDLLARVSTMTPWRLWPSRPAVRGWPCWVRVGCCSS